MQILNRHQWVYAKVNEKYPIPAEKRGGYNASLNYSYEQEIISMLLASDESMQNVILQSLSTRMFTNVFYRKIFEVCEHLQKSGHEINVYSVTEILNQNAED